MPKLTQRTAEALKAPTQATDLVVFDDDLPGFGMRVKASPELDSATANRIPSATHSRSSVTAKSGMQNK
jgi:hypothetical protein